MAKAGHNSGKGGPIDPAKLKSYVERIEAVEAEEADYKAAKKDIYVEVKAAGMRPKMVRKIVKERKKTEADAEDEAELELYRAALAMPGATYRSVSAKTGIPKSTLQRLVPRNKNGTSAPQPEDGDDGITESCGGVESRHAGRGTGGANSPVQNASTEHTGINPIAGVAPGPHDTITETGEADTSGADAGRPSEPSAPAEQSVNSDPPPGRVSADHYDGQGEQPGTHTSPGGPEVAHAAPPVSDDDLKPLPFLRGPSPANRRAV